MINLLLKKNKKEISREFIMRFFVVFLIVVFFGFLSSFLMLFPSYSLTLSKEKAVNRNIDIFEKTIDFRKKDLQVSLLNKENEKISFLDGVEDIYPTDFIAKFVDLKPSNLKITGIFYEIDSKKEKSFTLKGTYKKRGDLIDFADKLEGEDCFSKVDFPVSNLVKGEEPTFSIKIYLNEN